MCGTGECCDFSICEPFNPKTRMVCNTFPNLRSSCQLPSTCMKDVEHCPQPRRQKNGDVCHNDLNGVCWNGFCQHTVTQVCESVIGDVAVMDHESMLSNEDGTPFHNCGWSEDNNAPVQCQSDDVFCGSLYCKVNHTAWKLTG